MFILQHEIYDQPTLLYPPKLEEIHDFLYRRTIEGKAVKVENQGVIKLQVENNDDDDDKKEELKPEINEDFIALIKIEGTITKRAEMIEESSGLVSIERIESQIDFAIINGAMGIIFDINSPGGSSAGVEGLSKKIRGLKDKGVKTLSFVDGSMLSAAYWIGSAADYVFSAQTSAIGSIGVYTIHIDQTKFDEKIGVKRTIISAGKFKAIGNSFEPLSKEGRDKIQERIDSLYKIFVESVAENRDESIEDVSKVAEGEVFTGKEALNTVLIDGLSTREEAYKFLISEIGKDMTKDELKTKFPAVYSEIFEDGKIQGRTEYEVIAQTELNDKLEKAVQGERQRCLSILDIPGQPSLIETKREAIAQGSEINEVYKALYNQVAENATDKSLEQQRLQNTMTAQQIPDTKKPSNVTGQGSSAQDYLAAYEAFKGQGMPMKDALLMARKQCPEGHDAFIKEQQRRG